MKLSSFLVSLSVIGDAFSWIRYSDGETSDDWRAWMRSCRSNTLRDLGGVENLWGDKPETSRGAMWGWDSLHGDEGSNSWWSGVSFFEYGLLAWPHIELLHSASLDEDDTHNCVMIWPRYTNTNYSEDSISGTVYKWESHVNGTVLMEPKIPFPYKI